MAITTSNSIRVNPGLPTDGVEGLRLFELGILVMGNISDRD
jgi:hypothetical protein